jgi:hypothetical protein
MHIHVQLWWLSMCDSISGCTVRLQTFSTAAICSACWFDYHMSCGAASGRHALAGQ